MRGLRIRPSEAPYVEVQSEAERAAVLARLKRPAAFRAPNRCSRLSTAYRPGGRTDQKTSRFERRSMQVAQTLLHLDDVRSRHREQWQVGCGLQIETVIEQLCKQVGMPVGLHRRGHPLRRTA